MTGPVGPFESSIEQRQVIDRVPSSEGPAGALPAAECHQELAVLQQALQFIMTSDSLEDVRQIRDQAEALRVFAKSAAAGLEIQNRAAEVRLCAERKAGWMLAQLQLHGGNRRSSTHDEYLNLEKMGIDRNRSRRWQLVAAIPDDIFGQYISECRDQGREITAAALIRFSKHHVHAASSDQTNRTRGELGKVLTQLAELARKGQTFCCIFVHPQWPNRRAIGRQRSGIRLSQLYVSDLLKLPISELTSENCHLHLWSPSERLRDSMRVLEGWGFTYQSVLVCTREVPTYGDYWRTAQDFVVLGTKGKTTFKDSNCDSHVAADPNSPSGMEAIRTKIQRVSVGPFLELLGCHGNGWRLVVNEQCQVKPKNGGWSNE